MSKIGDEYPRLVTSVHDIMTTSVDPEATGVLQNRSIQSQRSLLFEVVQSFQRRHVPAYPLYGLGKIFLIKEKNRERSGSSRGGSMGVPQTFSSL